MCGEAASTIGHCGVAPGGDVGLGSRHLLAGAAEMKGRRPPQP